MAGYFVLDKTNPGLQAGVLQSVAVCSTGAFVVVILPYGHYIFVMVLSAPTN